MNAFIAALAAVCAARRLEQKRLVAPSRRVGNQWLDALARAGCPALNARVETLRSLAVELAAPALAREGLAVAPRRAEELVVAALLRRLLAGSRRYLHAAAPGPGLSAAVRESLSALRLQGVPGERLRARVLDDAGKAEDLRVLLGGLEQRLAELGLADYARVLRAAAARLASDPDALGRDTLVLVPGDLAPSGLEARLLEAIPGGRLLRVAVDPPGVPRGVRFACAVGEVNEVRAVLRGCLERGLPLDEVEVLYTDPAYARAFVDVFAAVDRPGAAPSADAAADAPATFAEGLPCTLSRPGRALAAWLRWAAAGHPQATLVAMVREGLLRVGEAGGDEEPRVGFSRLAALLRSIPVGSGAARYLERIDESLAAARLRLAGAAAGEGDGTDEGRLEEAPEQRRARCARRVEELEVLRELVGRVLGASQQADADAGAAAAVSAARRFLDGCARSAGRFDAFAAEKLREELEATQLWLGRAGGGDAADLRAWLEALPERTRVGGSGPRPGCLHLDRLGAGGHTGRPHLVVLGLDDARFPGAGLQDPLLLDGERRRLDAAMPTAASRLEETGLALRRLLGRQRGTVTLSWPSRDVVEDADRFPSQAVLDVFRIARGAPEADLDALLREAGPPCSFAPDAPERALDPGEWRLWRFTGGEAVTNAPEVLARRAPHLALGRLAAAGREGAAFTAWDGRVPRAGADLDPATPSGKVLSSNGLETVGACPRRFFYHYALGIEPPEELVLDSERWLDPLVTGSLLHEVFEEFVRGSIGPGAVPLAERRAAEIVELLERKLEMCRALHPVPSRAVFERERRLLRRTVETFLGEEARREVATGARPAFVEATLGMPPGEHGTPLDDPDPVPIALPDGRVIRVRGRIDRIDAPEDPGAGWEVWDYKTGSTFGYGQADPFPEGRKIQPYLYWRMVERRLRQVVDPAAKVRTFGYFFPGGKGRGERIRWDAGDLAGGAATLAALCAIVASGAFAATTDAGKDCEWCHYRRVCGDVVAQAAASARKILAGEPLLAPLRELRAKSLGAPASADEGEA